MDKQIKRIKKLVINKTNTKGGKKKKLNNTKC